MGAAPASVAKITRPLLPGIYPRKRLYKLLDQARNVPITWVSGPPGCGKTATVSGYLKTRRLRGIWYQVDEGDGDPATFFYYLGLAGREAAPRYRSPFPLLTPEFLPGLNAFAHRFFEALFGRLGAGSVLVFDNCQTAPSRSPFFVLLREGLSRLPKGITAILKLAEERRCDVVVASADPEAAIDMLSHVKAERSNGKARIPVLIHHAV